MFQLEHLFLREECSIQLKLLKKKELPNAIFDEIPEGYTIYQLKVDNNTTYANSIYPGDKIDLWLKTTENGILVFGEFISNIEVLAVRDNAGQNVFDVTSGRTPAWLLFAVKTDLYRYLKLAESISGMTIIPVPKIIWQIQMLGQLNIQVKNL